MKKNEGTVAGHSSSVIARAAKARPKQSVYSQGDKDCFMEFSSILSKELGEQKIECSLHELGKIELIRIYNSKDANYAIWKRLIKKYHYLGHGRLYGLQMRYLIKSEHFGLIGAISFSSPAWRLRAREKWD